MAEIVNVSSSPGANYTWTSGKFAWSSATAGKNWSTAYPAIYALSVATDLSFAELVQKLGIKRSSENLTFAEKTSRTVALNKFETLNFVETYTDLIAFVLRFVESLTFSEKYARSGSKALFEVFQVGEGLARQLVWRKYETLALAETYTDLIAFILRVSESFSLAEKPAKGITKPQAESFRLSDTLARSQVKRISEAVSFAEALGRTVAYRRSINEGFAIGEALKRERSTIEARKLFSGLDRLECVWTGSTLRESFDVDHVIPFDLWHNNDVWNLLPASKTANSKKSNKLPSTEILRSRKDCIVGYWELLRGKNSQRFDKEAETLLDMPTDNWQNALYGQMCNAVEVTALQRGVGRWPAP